MDFFSGRLRKVELTGDCPDIEDCGKVLRGGDVFQRHVRGMSECCDPFSEAFGCSAVCSEGNGMMFLSGEK
jgi:hypothetical protein